jgi:hypothetical protein
MDKLGVSFNLIVDEDKKEDLSDIAKIILHVMKIGTTFGCPYLNKSYIPLLVMSGNGEALIFDFSTADFPPVSISVMYATELENEIYPFDDPFYHLTSNSFEDLQVKMLDWLGRCRVRSGSLDLQDKQDKESEEEK